MQTPKPLPLHVKEQLEATASRFWTSVTNANKDADGVPAVSFSSGSSDEGQKKTQCHQPNSLQFIVNTMFSSCTTGGVDLDNSSSDGSGAPDSLLKHTNRSRATATTDLTQSSSRGETSAPAPVTPSPLHEQIPLTAVKSALQESKQLFKNNHDIAEEAIHRLRQQHKNDQTEKILTNSLHESEEAVFSDRERSVLSKSPSLLSNNLTTLSMNPSTLSNNRTISSSLVDSGRGTPTPSGRVTPTQTGRVTPTQQQQSRKSSLQKFISPRSKLPGMKAAAGKAQHSFFPASKPKDPPGMTRQELRLREKLKRNKGVPKEVTQTSPTRMLKNRNTQKQKQILNLPNKGDDYFSTNFVKEDNRDADNSWDIENDGVSDLTQSTVDQMVLAINQHLRVFPEEAHNLNRIRSDTTDPAPKGRPTFANVNTSFSELSFPMLGGDVAGFTRMATPPRGGNLPTKGLTPESFTRNIGSMGTRSFFTKTTHSTQTNDFANAWRVEEQKFWDTEVAIDKNRSFKKKVAKFDGLANSKSPGRPRGAKSTKRSGYTTNSTITTATNSFNAPKSPPSNRLHQQRRLEESQEVFLLADEDKLLLQNVVETAEI